ncbi:MAG: HDIG domain-containing metalloprotein, partial [Patescibacteria group bacterium]
MKIPSEVKNILTKLQATGFEAYAVGGCVRDLLSGQEPKDWDVATNALPEQIQLIFPDSFYENKFGTVSVKAQCCHPESPSGGEGSKKDSSLRSRSAQNDKKSDLAAGDGIEFVEVTTYRVDEKYTDKRHPDAVSFTRKLEDDLARRDFTINAMALRLRSGQAPEIVDPFKGQEDLKNNLIRTVGEPDKRFNEDALRMLRAVRFAVELPFFCSHPDPAVAEEGSKKDSSLRSRFIQNDEKEKNQAAVKQVSQKDVKQSFTPLEILEDSEGAKYAKQKLLTGFTIESKTKEAIKNNAAWLQAIAKERVRDEFVKIIMSDQSDEGVLLLHELGLLEFIIPEFTKGFGVAQNKHHIYSIFEHGVFSLKFATHPPKISKRNFDEAEKKNNLIIRLAALLHDVAKPQAKRGEGENATFYNHDIMGARASARILERLRFDNETIE